MKPTKKIIAEFPSIEKELLKRFNNFKKESTTANLSSLSISWGIWSTHRQIFNLDSQFTENEISDIYFVIQDYSKNILIF